MALKIRGWTVLLLVRLKRDLWSQLNNSFSVTHDPMTLWIRLLFRDNIGGIVIIATDCHYFRLVFQSKFEFDGSENYLL